jgi:hypothetical protein
METETKPNTVFPCINTVKTYISHTLTVIGAAFVVYLLVYAIATTAGVI